MMEEFYDEILKACGVISSIYFLLMPAASAIAANGEANFIAAQYTPDNARAKLKFHRVHRDKMLVVAQI